MSVLLVDGWAPAQAISVASASQRAFAIGVGVIDDEARVRDVFDPVMIHDVYHHEP
jgi:hypothetical protein